MNYEVREECHSKFEDPVPEEKKNIYIKACVQNKAQLCASSACISGYVLSDKEQNENINKQLCWINLATVVAGLMKSKLTESQQIDICKPINLLNKKWDDKNPSQARQLWLKPH